jgi:hypothetical protein
MALVSKNFSEIITFTRASSATYFDATGTLQTATTNTPRFDYNPSTLAAQGLLIEESRTNSIRNNTMQGASAGVSPTYWSASGTLSNGITFDILDAGTENGIAYVDIQVTGTSTVTGTATNISFEGLVNIAAVPSQVWAWSSYIKLVSGSLTNASLNGRIQWRTASTSISASDSSSVIPTSDSLSLQRFSFSGTAVALTAYAVPQLRIGTVNGETYNFTLRIGMPQMELGAFATSVIPTTSSAVTRAADQASVNTVSPWFNAAEGTLYAEAQWNAPSAVVQQFASQFAGDSNNYIAIYKESSPANVTARVRQSGANQAYLYTTGTVSANTTYKNAITYSASGFSACTNAGTVQTAPAGTIPTVSSLGLGKATYTNAVQLNGYLRRISYYPRVLSSAELQALTA